MCKSFGVFLPPKGSIFMKVFESLNPMTSKPLQNLNNSLVKLCSQTLTFKSMLEKTNKYLTFLYCSPGGMQSVNLTKLGTVIEDLSCIANILGSDMGAAIFFFGGGRIMPIFLEFLEQILSKFNIWQHNTAHKPNQVVQGIRSTGVLWNCAKFAVLEVP